MVETMEETAQPIPNAQISVFRRDERGSIFIMECSTDEFGKTQRIELDAPDSSHSTDIHSLTRRMVSMIFTLPKKATIQKSATVYRYLQKPIQR